MAFFLGGLVLYVLRQNERREKNYFDLVETTFRSSEEKTIERHLANQAAMMVLAEADRRQREEHEVMLRNQKSASEEHAKISEILNNLLSRSVVSK